MASSSHPLSHLIGCDAFVRWSSFTLFFLSHVSQEWSKLKKKIKQKLYKNCMNIYVYICV